MKSPRFNGHFIDGVKGRLFVLEYPALGFCRGCAVVVPPFAEEMNKSRRAVALLARGLANRGIATVVPDLYGTGDSHGDFSDADWSTWRADLEAVWHWCSVAQRPVTSAVAVRLGAALLADCAQAGKIFGLARTVFWQPALDGSRYLLQFLRLRTAASMMIGRAESAGQLRFLLDTAGSIEVAGYILARGLAGEMEKVRAPSTLPASLGDVAWMEVKPNSTDGLSAPAESALAAERAAGRRFQASVVPGEPFWTSTEIVVNAQLIDTTIDYLANDQASL